MTHDPSPDARFKAAQSLARKIELLLDVVRASDGATYQFKEIQEALERNHNVKLTRSRWQDIKTGNTLVAQPENILRALAAFFDVPAEYLLQEDGELPDRVQQELELLRSMRRARVRDFATRTLADVDNETLQAITELLEDSEDL